VLRFLFPPISCRTVLVSLRRFPLGNLPLDRLDGADVPVPYRFYGVSDFGGNVLPYFFPPKLHSKPIGGALRGLVLFHLDPSIPFLLRRLAVPASPMTERGGFIASPTSMRSPFPPLCSTPFGFPESSCPCKRGGDSYLSNCIRWNASAVITAQFVLPSAETTHTL